MGDQRRGREDGALRDRGPLTRVKPKAPRHAVAARLAAHCTDATWLGVCVRVVEAASVDRPALLTRTPDHFLNDGRQIFVKISYLFQY